MATIPTIDFRPEDFLDGGKVSAQKMADAVNKVNRSLREALSRGLTQDNLRTQTVALTFTTKATVADTFPLPAIALAQHMPATPKAVRVTNRRNNASPETTFTSASDVDWSPTEGKKLSIRYVSGLSASTNYTITLLVEG